MPYHYQDKTQLLHGGVSRYFNDQLFSDITIVASDGRRLRCHQLILAASSPCFQRIMETGSLRSGTELPVLGVDSGALEAVLSFFYTGECHLILPGVVALCDAAQRLEVVSLAEACEEYIAGTLQPSNCCSVLSQVLAIGHSGLVRHCLQAAERWFDEVQQTDDFCSAPFATLSAILQHCRGSKSIPDDKLFRVAWVWSMCDLNNMKHLQDVSKLVTLPPLLRLEQLLQLRPAAPAHRAAFERLLSPGSQSRLHLEALVLKIWPALAGHVDRAEGGAGGCSSIANTPGAHEAYDNGGAISSALVVQHPSALQNVVQLHADGGICIAPPAEGKAGQDTPGGLRLDLSALAQFAYGMMSGMSAEEALAASNLTKALRPQQQLLSDGGGGEASAVFGVDAVATVGTSGAGQLRIRQAADDEGSKQYEGERYIGQQHGPPFMVPSSDSSMTSDRSGGFNVPPSGIPPRGDNERRPHMLSSSQMAAAGQLAHTPQQQQQRHLQQHPMVELQHQRQQDDDRAYFEEQLQHVLRDNNKWDIEFGQEGMQVQRMAPTFPRPPAARPTDLLALHAGFALGPAPVLRPPLGGLAFNLVPVGALRTVAAASTVPPAMWHPVSLAADNACGGGGSGVAEGVYGGDGRPGDTMPTMRKVKKGSSSAGGSGNVAEVGALVGAAHSRAVSVKKDGVDQRFCHTCSAFHLVADFDSSGRHIACCRGVSPPAAMSQGGAPPRFRHKRRSQGAAAQLSSSPQAQAGLPDQLVMRGPAGGPRSRADGSARVPLADVSEGIGGSPDVGRRGAALLTGRPDDVKEGCGSPGSSRAGSPAVRPQAGSATWGLHMLADIASLEAHEQAAAADCQSGEGDSGGGRHKADFGRKRKHAA